ncbi:MAG: Pvc16 family protein [Mycobacteriales bacterium]
MSSALALPAVTAALATIVQEAVDGCGLTPRPLVTTGPLDAGGADTAAVVHLYRVTSDPSLAANALPARVAGDDPTQRPRIALNLHYLIAFGGPSDLVAQQLLAATALALHVEPVLTASRFAAAEAAYPQIAGSGLEAMREPLRVISNTLPLDELIRMWAVYPPGSSRLTLAVSCGPVIISG